jgi:D-glycero-alpha-D-manno-heptose 1-phosphate guanylyltransferase
MTFCMAGPGMINAGCYVFPGEILTDVHFSVPFSLENDYLVEGVAAGK